MAKILWIEDQYDLLKGMLRPLSKGGHTVEYAVNAYDGWVKAKNWKHYALIVVDLILPLSDSPERLPAEIAHWKDEKYPGIGLLKWLLGTVDETCKVVVITVVPDDLSRYGVDRARVVELAKQDLRPSVVARTLTPLLPGGAPTA